MDEDKKNKDEVKKPVNDKKDLSKDFGNKGFQKTDNGSKRSFGSSKPFGGRRGGRFSDFQKPEFDQKTISVRRVTRVVAGGRRFSFSVALVIGDRKGSVGVGLGKASDTAAAIQKAVKDAKNNMISIKFNDKMSIDHDISTKYSSVRIIMMPNEGRGVVAGSSVRDVLELSGIKDVSAKILSRSKNKLNNAKAAIKALSFFAEKKKFPEAKKEENKKE